MAHQFPEIVAYGTALRFALEAEQACADLAAAAGVLAPDQAWRDKLEEVVYTHDDRVQKRTRAPQETGEMARASIHSLDRTKYLGTLDAEPATTWPPWSSSSRPRKTRRVPRGLRHAVQGRPRRPRRSLREERPAGPGVRRPATGAARLAARAMTQALHAKGGKP